MADSSVHPHELSEKRSVSKREDVMLSGGELCEPQSKHAGRYCRLIRVTMLRLRSASLHFSMTDVPIKRQTISITFGRSIEPSPYHDYVFRSDDLSLVLE